MIFPYDIEGTTILISIHYVTKKMANCTILSQAIDAVLDEFDTKKIGIPCDPKRWSKANVKTCLEWIVKTFMFDESVDLSGLLDCTGYRLVISGRHRVVNISPNHFGTILWELLEKLKKKKNHKIFLWQFILDLLVDERYMNVISFTGICEWEFRIHDTQEFARLWGVCNNSPNMNFTKLGRMLRYYQNKGTKKCNSIMMKMPDYKCCYRFVCDIEKLITYTCDNKWYDRFIQKLTPQ
jgi:Ets-domain/Sterile alpha motif (SAM)/Pointed domain